MYQVIGIIIMAIFYGCYFIKMLLQRRKGIKTDHIGKGKVGIVKVIEILMKIATLFTPLVELISIVLNWQMLPDWARITGIVIASTGDFIFVISVITMRDSWRAGVSEDEKTELVTNGIYQISRNPAFLSFDLVYIGILLMFFNWLLVVVSLFAMIMFHLQIVNVEEAFLVQAFGDEYLKYRKHVNRYLGRR